MIDKFCTYVQTYTHTHFGQNPFSLLTLLTNPPLPYCYHLKYLLQAWKLDFRTKYVLYILRRSAKVITGEIYTDHTWQSIKQSCRTLSHSNIHQWTHCILNSGIMPGSQVHPVLGSSAQRRHGFTEACPAKILKGLQHLAYKERSRKVQLFSLGMRLFKGWEPYHSVLIPDGGSQENSQDQWYLVKQQQWAQIKIQDSKILLKQRRR